MKKWIIGIGVALLIGGGVVGAVVWTQSTKEVAESEQAKFQLSQEGYERGELVEISAEDFAELIKEQKNFLVVVKLTICPAEFPITNVAKQLAKEKDVAIFELTEAEFKKTELSEKIKYLPSAAIYHNGELVDFLDAEADEDLEYYRSVEGLEKWLELNGVEI